MRDYETKKQFYKLQIDSHILLRKSTNSSYYLNSNEILPIYENALKVFLNNNPEYCFTEEEKKLFVRDMKAIYEIYQEEGSVILGHYEHDYNWYKDLLSKDSFEQYYWNRYKHYLSNTKHFSSNIIDTLENKTLKSIMSYLGNPNTVDTKFAIRGLVVGDVQSGKTSNYLGLVTKAVDAGYKVIIILTGTIESLRKQTQERVEEGFIGFDSHNGNFIGVGKGERTPIAFTSRNNDFTGDVDKNTSLKISDNKEPMVFVLKKNAQILTKLNSSLKRIHGVTDQVRINSSILMIDDEADNASINTKNQEDPTKINELIRETLSLFNRNSYVGFTATPFANVFICYDENEMQNCDLFPKDFIYALKTPSNYQGSKKYFFDPNNNLKYIKDSNEDIFPLKHKKDFVFDSLFDSFYHAIRCFVLINAIRDYREINKFTDRSMLINMSRYCSIQSTIKHITEVYFDYIKRNIKQSYKYSLEKALQNRIILSLKESFENEFSNIEKDGKIIKFNDILPYLYDSIKDVKIQIVNSSRNSTKLNYDDKKGTRVIAIGGLALSRGLTLEGLCVSYFYRNSSTYDVLMQMGRWFGYREDYKDLVKIFMTKQSADYYRDICHAIDILKNDIEVMCKQGKKPIDFGIRVLNDSRDLQITASNKLKNAKAVVYTKSFYGSLFETPYLHRDLTIINKNIENTISFINNLELAQRDWGVGHPYFRNVDKKMIIDLLNKLSIHEANESFNIKQFLNFMNSPDFNLNKFDVLIMGGSTKNKKFYDNRLKIDIPLVKRKFDIINNDIIRMNGCRAHLWGRGDAKNGLSGEQVKGFAENVRAQEYLVEGRNPLFVIYFINPCNDDSEFNQDEMKLNLELINSQYNYLVGYSIGFPNMTGKKNDSELYFVHKDINYYEKDHDDMDGDDYE